MTITLTTQNKVGFVDGSIHRPHLSNLLIGVWTHYNSMVISQLLNVVARDIIDSLLPISTTTEIWNDLCERFHQNNGLQIFQIKKHLIELYQSVLDVNTYYTGLKILWDELKDFQMLLICECIAT